MKNKLIIILIILSSLYVKSQNIIYEDHFKFEYDTTKSLIINNMNFLDVKISKSNYYLDKYHKTHNNGMLMCLFGLGLLSYGNYINIDTSNKHSKPIMILGGTMIFSGTNIMIFSQKFNKISKNILKLKL